MLKQKANKAFQQEVHTKKVNLCLVLEMFELKCEEKKIVRKNRKKEKMKKKKRFEVHNLFLHVSLNSIHLFFFFHIKIK